MRLKTVILILAASSCYYACSRKIDDTSTYQTEQEQGFNTQLGYAKNLEIVHENGMVRATIKAPYKGASNSLEYLFVPKGAKIPDNTNGVTIIHTPVERLVCTSTTYLSFLELLEANASLVGFPSTKYISSSDFISRVNSGDIIDLGRDSNINMELLLELDPEVVLTYAVAGISANDDQITKSGIPVVVGAGYLEEEPLGRAEWIKFVALFFGKEEAADSIFNEIKINYEQVLAIAQSAKTSPTVFTGTVYKDTWYMPGGNSWAGKYFNAAESDYLWKNDQESGSMELSFESVYDQAYDAEYWIGTDGYATFSSLTQADKRYQDFRAFKERNVYSYNKRINENGANDYFEAGLARPDIVLSDIVKILHPEQLPDHELYFYEQLKE